MGASQYKDYVRFVPFSKHIGDEDGDSGDFAPAVGIPRGASFTDMVALKGKPEIGDRIDALIIQPLIDANTRPTWSDFPDFDDPNKLREGQAMVDRLTSPIGIFRKPEPDLSQNRARHDDILGDADEGLTLLRHRQRPEQGPARNAVRGGDLKGQVALEANRGNGAIAQNGAAGKAAPSKLRRQGMTLEIVETP